MAWRYTTDTDVSDEQGWPTLQVSFEDPKRFPDWRLDLTYVVDPSAPDSSDADPFPVLLVEIVVRRFADGDGPPLTPTRFTRLDIVRAWQQGEQIAADRLRGAPDEGPGLPAGYPHRGPNRDRWYRELLEAIDIYTAAGQTAMDTYRLIAERKGREVGTVKRWVHEARQIAEEDEQ